MYFATLQMKHEGDFDMDMSATHYFEGAVDINSSFIDRSLEAPLRTFLIANYDRLHRRLHRYFGCSDQASDSLHDAWLRLGEMKLPAVIQNPEAYVYRVACNIAVDNLRSNGPWQYNIDIDDVMEYVADEVPGPELVAEMRSTLNAVDRALQALPYRYQDILLSMRLEELTRQEVALRHGISLRNVDTMLRQALDYCATQTGQLVVGGVSTPRRCLSQHRYVKARATSSLKV